MASANSCGNKSISTQMEINVLLLEDQSQAKLIGFITCKNDPNIKLNEVRKIILNEFDDLQLTTIGQQFKFIKKNKPISFKQEQNIKMNTISQNMSISNIKSNNINDQSSNNLLPFPQQIDIYSSTFTKTKYNLIPSQKESELIEYNIFIRKTEETDKIFSNSITSVVSDKISVHALMDKQQIDEKTNKNIFNQSFITSNPKSPKQTRLEKILGNKLPRIRPDKSSNDMMEQQSNEIELILKNALISSSNIIESKSEDIELSINENTHLKSKSTKKLDSNSTQATPPNIFKSENKTAFHYNNNNNNIKCKITVIGTVDKQTMVWKFFNEKDLIKGLSAVHHSSTSPLWLDIVCNSETFINIAEHIRPSIHNLTIEDCLTLDCREKLEIFRHYLYIVVHISSCLNNKNTENLNILVFKTMVITYHLGSESTCKLIFDCYNILSRRHYNICPSSGWIFHTLIDNIIDKLIPGVQSSVDAVESCQQLIFQLTNTSQNELLHRMQRSREWLVLYKYRLMPKSLITTNLLNYNIWRKDFLKDVPQPYWNDIHDHVTRMCNLLELGTQTLESVQNIFVNKVSLEMTQQSNMLANVAGKLTSIGAIFIPLTIITGFWGMNCKVPFQYNPDGNGPFDNNHYGLIIIFIIMIISSIITWKFVNAQGWFDPTKRRKKNKNKNDKHIKDVDELKIRI